MTSPLSKEQLKLADEAVEKAVQRESFSMLDFISNGGVVMPSKKIDIFTDVEANFEIEEIDQELDRLMKLAKAQKSIVGPDPELAEPLEARRTELAERNEKSHLIFHMRGVHPAVDDEIKRELQKRGKKTPWEGTEWGEAYNSELLAKAIVKVERVIDGVADTHAWTAEEADRLVTNLPSSEASKLLNAVHYLTSGVRLADRRVDAGFPGGSTDVAGESADLLGSADGGNLG